MVGLMPTFVLVSRTGVISNSYTFDHCGPLARTVEDCAPTLQASETVRTAMDAALDVLRRLGATLEECRVRPLGQYYDVKIIIAESEIFSVHQQNLIARPTDFGADFRSRVLPS